MTELVESVDFERAADFVAALGRRSGRWDPRPQDWIFRGQSDASWTLLPSAFRPGVVLDPENPSRRGPLPTHGTQVGIEALLLLRFLEVADRSGLPLPVPDQTWLDNWYLRNRITQAADSGEKWPFPEIGPLMALAQHYGLPTRLLDWCRRPLHAAYFAAIGSVASPPDSGQLAVWAFDPKGARQLNRRPPWKFMVVRAPGGSNSFLQAQAGVFTLAGHWKPQADGPPVPPPLEEMLPMQTKVFRDANLDVPVERATILSKLSLPASEACELLYMLSEEWIDGASLFPGYEGAARAVMERRWYP